MQIVPVKIYTYEELSEEVKIGLRNEYNVPDDWCDELIRELEDKLFEKGYYNVDIKWSGFCSQGDGASFTASIDLIKFIKYLQNDTRHSDMSYVKLLEALEEDEIYITENIIKRDRFTRYVHENTTTLYLDFISTNCGEEEPSYELSNSFNDLVSKIEKQMRDFNKNIYKNIVIFTFAKILEIN